jgi:hypothetical protein
MCAVMGTYLKECTSACNGGTCTPVFIAAQFTIVKLWRQPRYPTTDEWFIYTMEYYSVIKKNEIMLFVRK